MIDDTLGILASVQAMYERYIAEVRKESPELAAQLPGWGDLSAEQTFDWMASYAATVEVSYRMARATSGLPTEAMRG